MVKETHIKGGYVFALLTLPFINNTYLKEYNFIYTCILLIIYIYFSHLGSLYPDIDMKGSFISKRYPLIYKKFGSKFKHRGFTHSLLSLSLLSYIINLLMNYSSNNIVLLCVCSGFFVGYASHLFFDLLTKEGIEVFYPISINFSLLPIKTSSKAEKFICKVLNFVIIFLIGYKFSLII